MSVQTQVGIIGAGPAGVVLALLLRQAGIDCVVIERRNRAYVEGRVRAGVLEPIAVETLRRLGVAARLDAQGIEHRGTKIATDGELFRVDLAALTGRTVTVYGQQAVMGDLFDAAAARELRIVWNARDAALHDLDSDAPTVIWSDGAGAQQLQCDFVVGCDGLHGVSRAAIPAAVLRTFERVYPFGWLGILADVPPVVRRTAAVAVCEEELS